MSWAIAMILYALPILAGIRHFDELEDCKEWMRSDDGEWFPSLAPLMVIVSLLGWPLFAALDAIAPREDKQ